MLDDLLIAHSLKDLQQGLYVDLMGHILFWDKSMVAQIYYVFNTSSLRRSKKQLILRKSLSFLMDSLIHRLISETVMKYRET